MSFHHVSVLLDESVAALAPRDGGVYVDCTLGGGGHTEALLEAASCTVYGIDRDPEAIAAASERLARFGDRFVPVRSDFGNIQQALAAHGVTQVDGVLADLGVSSHQLDTAERGFSFRHDGPLDMRMDPDQDLSAATIVNEWDEAEIARIIWRYGEERASRRIARVIVEGRPWESTLPLADAIARVVGRGKGRIHPATRSFQGIRIAVNAELDQVEQLLPDAQSLLAPSGRLAIITFHSLEDRIVKHFIAEQAGKNAPKDAYGHPLTTPSLKALSNITPRKDDPNPRARSARLRVAERLPWNASQ